MIIDTSAIVAIIRDEADRQRLQAAIIDAGGACIPAGSLLELYIVIDGRRDAAASQSVDDLIEASGIVIEPVTHEQARLARAAYRAFGRGSGHPAGLNFGDCFAYALAKARGEPLLFKGEDFARTDLEAVLATPTAPEI